MMQNEPHQRRIQSFVLRTGRMTLAQQQALQQQWTQYGLLLTDKPIDFTKAFARSALNIVEIGFGMGDSLWQMAKMQPECNFLGIEVHTPGVGALLAKIAAEKIENIRVLTEDAVEVFQTQIIDNSLDGIQIYFPDPWPKRRHHKRRLIQAEFTALLVKKLKPDGYLHLATDWEDYAKQMMKVLTENESLENTVGANQFIEGLELRSQTKFERRGQRLGHDIWDLLFRKTMTNKASTIPTALKT